MACANRVATAVATKASPTTTAHGRAYRVAGRPHDFEESAQGRYPGHDGRDHPCRRGTRWHRVRRRRIPEATVARLPLYYRALLETAEHEIGTVSSERLAELAGVNAAKVRKDLSYLGSYGTRGVGYDVEYLLHEISRELGLTHDWPVAIVGIGNLGQALANYRGFGARGFRVVAARRRRPREGRAAASATSRSSRSTTSRRIVARARRSPSASSPRPPRAAQEVADRLVDAGVTLDPQLRARRSSPRPRRRLAAQGRPRDRAADPVLLPTARVRPRAAAARAPQRRPRAAPRDDAAAPAIAGYPVNLLVARAPVRGRRRRPHRGPQDRGRCSTPGADVARRRARGRRRGAGAGPTPGRLDARRARRSRPPTSTAPGSPPPPPAIPAVDRAVFEAGEARRVWVNSADDPGNCSFTLMSVVRQGDLVVTIGTGGRSPALAAWLQARASSDELGPEYATLLDLLVRGPGRAAGLGAFE